MPNNFTRRNVLQAGLAGSVVAAAPSWITERALADEDAKKPDANSRVGLAIIGCGRRGQNYLDVGIPPRGQVVVACDVHRERAAAAAGRAGCRDIVQDYRRAIDRADVDAVLIATPDHWHALIAIAACQAGKHVYVECPGAVGAGHGRHRPGESPRGRFSARPAAVHRTGNAGTGLAAVRRAGDHV